MSKRDKEIIKLAKILCEDCKNNTHECDMECCDAALESAECIYEAGYRRVMTVEEQVNEMTEIIMRTAKTITHQEAEGCAAALFVEGYGKERLRGEIERLSKR